MMCRSAWLVVCPGRTIPLQSGGSMKRSIKAVANYQSGLNGVIDCVYSRSARGLWPGVNNECRCTGGTEITLKLKSRLSLVLPRIVLLLFQSKTRKLARRQNTCEFRPSFARALLG